MIYSITLDWEIVLICTLKIHYKKFYYSVSSGFDIFTHASLYGEKKKNEAQSSGKCMTLWVCVCGLTNFHLMVLVKWLTGHQLPHASEQGDLFHLCVT